MHDEQKQTPQDVCGEAKQHGGRSWGKITFDLSSAQIHHSMIRRWKKREFLRHHWKDVISVLKFIKDLFAYNSYKSSSLGKSILSTMLLSCQLTCDQVRKEGLPDRRLSCQFERCTKSNSYVFCGTVIDMKIFSLGNLSLSFIRSDD